MSNLAEMRKFLALGTFNPSNGCFEMAWSKSKYPTFVSRGKIAKASRLSYMWANGLTISPDGMMVCHTCDNTKCVHPDHLFLGTNQDNMVDMIRKNRGKRQVMTFEIAMKAKQMLAEGIYWTKVSERLNVKGFAIRDLACDKSWLHLPPVAAPVATEKGK